MEVPGCTLLVRGASGLYAGRRPHRTVRLVTPPPLPGAAGLQRIHPPSGLRMARRRNQSRRPGLRLTKPPGFKLAPAGPGGRGPALALARARPPAMVVTVTG
jgi:hypothetical protein